MSVVSRWLLFLVALWIQSAGIVLVVKSFLGTSPISSLPYVMSETFPFTFGETTFAVNMVFLLGQMLILKKKFPKVQLLQAPMTMIFAAFIDLCMQAFGNITPDAYWQKLITLFLGASMVSLGVALQGIADVLKLPGGAGLYRFRHLSPGLRQGQDRKRWDPRDARHLSLLCGARLCRGRP